MPRLNVIRGQRAGAQADGAHAHIRPRLEKSNRSPRAAVGAVIGGGQLLIIVQELQPVNDAAVV
jgi:hypothetical protein